jgi:hypothetical protein
MVEALVSKPVVAGLVAGILDKVVMGQTDYMSSVKFASAVGLGTLLGDTIGVYVADSMGSTDQTGSNTFSDGFAYTYSGTTIFQRAIEVSVGSATAYGINKFVLTNDWSNNPRDIAQRVGIVLASQVVSEYVMDYYKGRPVSYIANMM